MDEKKGGREGRGRRGWERSRVGGNFSPELEGLQSHNESPLQKSAFMGWAALKKEK